MMSVDSAMTYGTRTEYGRSCWTSLSSGRSALTSCGWCESGSPSALWSVLAATGAVAIGLLLVASYGAGVDDVPRLSLGRAAHAHSREPHVDEGHEASVAAVAL